VSGKFSDRDMSIVVQKKEGEVENTNSIPAPIQSVYDKNTPLWIIFISAKSKEFA
jgi:hypothetical protein